MVLNKSWLLLAIPGAIVAIVLLALTATSLVRTVRRSVVASVPVLPEQTLTFTESGSYVLNVEGKSFTRAAAGLSFELTKEAASLSIPLHAILVRTKVSSFSRTRLELYRFEIPDAGRYTLRISGANAGTEAGDAAVVITRSFTVTMVLHILALVALGALFVGSLVVTGLVFAERA